MRIEIIRARFRAYRQRIAELEEALEQQENDAQEQLDRAYYQNWQRSQEQAQERQRLADEVSYQESRRFSAESKLREAGRL